MVWALILMAFLFLPASATEGPELIVPSEPQIVQAEIDYDALAEAIVEAQPDPEEPDYEAMAEAFIAAQDALEAEKEPEEVDYTGLASAIAEAIPEPEEVVIPDVVATTDYIDPGDGIVSYAAGDLSGSVYNGSFSSSILTYFQGLFPKIPWGAHYVCFRGGQYDYYLFFGSDLSFSGSSFSGDGLECVHLYTYSSSGSGYQLSSSSDNSLSLAVNGYVVYSDLGYFPCLASDSSIDMIILFWLVLIFLSGLIRSIWQFLLRRGGTS